MQGVRFVIRKMLGLARPAHFGSLSGGFHVDVCANKCMGSTRSQGQGNFAADAAPCRIGDECTVLCDALNEGYASQLCEGQLRGIGKASLGNMNLTLPAPATSATPSTSILGCFALSGALYGAVVLYGFSQRHPMALNRPGWCQGSKPVCRDPCKCICVSRK